MPKGSFNAELHIDWNQFRRQQRTLSVLHENGAMTPGQRVDLEALMRLLSVIQDAGFESGLFTEAEVYGHPR
jgi:hypothetical protein